MPKKQESNLRASQKELNRQIKEQDFKSVYLICGEQAYLRTQNRDKLKKAVLGDGDEMNSSYYTGDGFTAHEIIDLAETLPFFAERRVIVLENTFLWGKGTADADSIADYIKDIPETTVMIFVEEKPKGTTKLYKQIKKYGYIMDCETPSDQDLRLWTAARFQKAGHRISVRTLDTFLAWVGTDMLSIANETEKLIAYAGDREEITQDDVHTISSPLVRDRIFDMISAIGDRNPEKALSIYMDMLKLQTPPQVILSLMTRQFNQLLQAGELMRTHPDREVAEIMGLNPWVVSNRLRPQLSKYTGRGLTRALQDCVQANMDYRSGKVDPQIAVERLIAVYSGAGSRTK